MIIKLDGVTAAELHSLHQFLDSRENRAWTSCRVRDSGFMNVFCYIKKVENEHEGAIPDYKVTLEVPETFRDMEMSAKKPVPMEIATRLLRSMSRFETDKIPDGVKYHE